ncbi:MAG: hypothetical protein CEN92_348 [Candidatus Berkelbacteria bacterium Licking1014_96]|uniref:Uncharacterized protein n=1 Tax=Candidatus Berkelbacteria bacterium Licking1014_96 TaxID=2017149 RepID=A0A554LDQ4_9BACT|nr:MAG: hypothetical protein CEN92_348 [Candidatus Berkelbacteria bacterium Licking1014_96]
MAKKEEVEIKKKPKRHVRGIWAVTIIFIICALFGAGIWYFIFSQTENSFSLTIPKKPTPTPTENKEGLKTYTNLSALFSFDYPNTWVLEEKNNTIYLSSDTEYPQKYLSGEMPAMKETDLYIQIHFSNETLDISREAPSGKPKISNLTIGGVSAKRVTYKNETDLQEIIQNLKAGDFYFLITCDTKVSNADKIESYNKILESFKFGETIIKDK